MWSCACRRESGPVWSCACRRESSDGTKRPANKQPPGVPSFSFFGDGDIRTSVLAVLVCTHTVGIEVFCAWDPYANLGGVCPIQACRSCVFHALDLVGSSRLGMVCSVSQHAWVWLVRWKSSRLGVVSSIVSFSRRTTTLYFLSCQN